MGVAVDCLLPARARSGRDEPKVPGSGPQRKRVEPVERTISWSVHGRASAMRNQFRRPELTICAAVLSMQSVAAWARPARGRRRGAVAGHSKAGRKPWRQTSTQAWLMARMQRMVGQPGVLGVADAPLGPALPPVEAFKVGDVVPGQGSVTQIWKR